MTGELVGKVSDGCAGGVAACGPGNTRGGVGEGPRASVESQPSALQDDRARARRAVQHLGQITARHHSNIPFCTSVETGEVSAEQMGMCCLANKNEAWGSGFEGCSYQGTRTVRASLRRTRSRVSG